MTNKIFRKIFITFTISGIFVFHSSAQTLTPPSLQTVMRQNEERYQEENSKPSQEILNEIKEDTFSYETIYQGNAIHIKKAKEASLYIQEISLDKGAKITSSLELAGYNENSGEPQFIKKTINEVLKNAPKNSISGINGQFFNPKIQPSELSFGLKTHGIIRTAGADNRNEKKHILHINGEIAEILPYSWKNLATTSGDFAMVNLNIENPRHKNENIGRTYICLANPDKFLRSSKILTFFSESMTEPVIESEILKNGCTKKSVSKLDSSGSSRFWHQDIILYGENHAHKPDYRKIPHYLIFQDTNS